MRLTLPPVWELTDEHSASSYGIPVLVRRSDGQAFGPGDLVTVSPLLDPEPAWQAIERLAAGLDLDEEEERFVRIFVAGGRPW